MNARRRTNDTLVGLGIAAVVLLLLEAMARVAVTVRDDFTAGWNEQPTADPRWASYSPTLGWVNKPNFRGETVGGTWRDFDSAGYFAVDSAQVANGTLPKILFIGDSNTFGFGVDARSTFAEVVEGLLPGTEAINLGVPGYTSYQGRVVLEKYLPILRPDLVVVSFNFNDRRYADDDLPDGPETFQRLFAQSQRAPREYTRPLEKLYLFRALRSGMQRAGLLKEPTTGSVSLETLRPRVDEEAYHDNLAHMADVARRARVPLVFVVLMDNPIQTYHVREGSRLLANAEYATAIDHLLVGTSVPSFGTLARFALARAYRATGEPQSSVEKILRISLRRSVQGGVVIRPDTQYSEIMREVARREGVELVDATSLLAEHPGTYMDDCHFNAEGHRLVGELLATRIGDILALPPSQSYRAGMSALPSSTSPGSTQTPTAVGQ